MANSQSAVKIEEAQNIPEGWHKNPRGIEDNLYYVLSKIHSHAGNIKNLLHYIEYATPERIMPEAMESTMVEDRTAFYAFAKAISNFAPRGPVHDFKLWMNSLFQQGPNTGQDAELILSNTDQHKSNNWPSLANQLLNYSLSEWLLQYVPETIDNNFVSLVKKHASEIFVLDAYNYPPFAKEGRIGHAWLDANAIHFEIMARAQQIAEIDPIQMRALLDLNSFKVKQVADTAFDLAMVYQELDKLSQMPELDQLRQLAGKSQKVEDIGRE